MQAIRGDGLELDLFALMINQSWNLRRENFERSTLSSVVKGRAAVESLRVAGDPVVGYALMQLQMSKLGNVACIEELQASAKARLPFSSPHWARLAAASAARRLIIVQRVAAARHARVLAAALAAEQREAARVLHEEYQTRVRQAEGANHSHCPFSSLITSSLLLHIYHHTDDLISLVTRCNHSHCPFSSLIISSLGTRCNPSHCPFSSLITSSLLLYTYHPRSCVLPTIVKRNSSSGCFGNENDWYMPPGEGSTREEAFYLEHRRYLLQMRLEQ